MNQPGSLNVMPIVDMFSTVFIGNAMTKMIGGAMVTPRGYRRKEVSDA